MCTVGGFDRRRTTLSLHAYRTNTRLTKSGVIADCQRRTEAAFRSWFVREQPKKKSRGKAMQRFLPLPKGWWVRMPHILMGPLSHSHDGRLRFATNSLGSNVANASGVSASRNEQSSGCSHCAILPTMADCSMMAALRFLRRAS
jgi:hypothetical protein